MGNNKRLPIDPLSKCPGARLDEPALPPIDPVLSATDTIAEFRRVSALAVVEIAAWADILHRAA